jgi:hypothetical protein
MPIAIDPPFDCECSCGEKFKIYDVADHGAIIAEPELRTITCPVCNKWVCSKTLDELGVRNSR